MYQTVGHDAIALVGQALGIPLHRRVIQGSPVEHAVEYGLTSPGGGGIVGDETEDLYALLCNVLVCLPLYSSPRTHLSSRSITQTFRQSPLVPSSQTINAYA